MTMPAGIATVALTGRYVHPDGSPLAGTVSFSAPDYLRLPGADTTAVGSVTATLDVAGEFSVVLIATDNAGARPINFTYTVTETLTGVSPRTYYVALPQSAGTVALADIAPATQSGGEYLLVTGPAGRTILNGIVAPTSGAGADGDFWLDYAAWTIYGPKVAGAWPSGHALGSGGAVASVNGFTGTVALTAANVGADPAGAASTAQATAGTYTDTKVAAEVTRANAAYLQKEGNLSELTDPALARTNLAITPANIGALSASEAAAAYSPLSTSDTGAWVFNVKSYSAKGDGKLRTDGAMTSGSAVLTCATSTPFTSADVGKLIMVKGAAATGVTSLSTTITGFTDSGHVTLGASASTTISGALVMWATDDTAAIQAAINAAVTWAQANSGAARVFVPGSTGFFGVGGALVTGGSTLGNSQLTLPVIATTGRKIVLTIEGVTTGSGLQHWEQTVPQTSGSTLVSFGVFSSISGQSTSITANGNPSVIGAAAQPAGYGKAPGLFSNMNVTLLNLSILTAYSRYGLTYSPFDFSGLANASTLDSAWGTTGTVPNGDFTSVNQFANGLSIGGLMPAAGNNDHSIVRNCTVHGGYTYGFYATEHTVVDTMRILYCWSGFCVVGLYFESVGATHAIKASQLSVEVCTNNIHIIGVGSNGVGPFIDIDQLDTETSAPTFTDNTSGAGLAAARGTIKLTGLYTAANVNVTGPTGLKIVDGQKSFPVATKTANYTVSVVDDTILVNATAGAVTITLISAANTPNSYTVKKTDSSANAVTVTAAGAEKIDGAATKALTTQWASTTVIPSGGNWFTV